MKIGTVRPEEARVFDKEAGFHSFVGTDPMHGPYAHGSYEVFWANEGVDDVYNGPGWYWWSCFPGCLPDSDPCGPFASSTQARRDADENWE